MRGLAAFLLVAVCGVAQPALHRPVLGQMLDREGTLRPVTGVAGSFQLDPPVAERVLATACSAMVCLAKTEAGVVSGASSVSAPGGGAMMAIDGTGAWIYFPATNQLARWQEGSLTAAEVSVSGEVLGLRAGSGGVEFAVRRETGAWIVTADGTIVDSLPSETGAVLLLADSLAYSTGDALVLRRSDGSELRFAVAGVTRLFALGDGYVEAMTRQGIFALRTVAGQEKLFVLPGAPFLFPAAPERARH